MAEPNAVNSINVQVQQLVGFVDKFRKQCTKFNLRIVLERNQIDELNQDEADARVFRNFIQGMVEDLMQQNGNPAQQIPVKVKAEDLYKTILAAAVKAEDGLHAIRHVYNLRTSLSDLALDGLWTASIDIVNVTDGELTNDLKETGNLKKEIDTLREDQDNQ